MDPNPYASPAGESSYRKLTVRRRFPVLLWLAFVAYGWFTVELLTSVGDDVVAGYMFSVNASILLAGCLWASLKYGKSALVAFGMALLQLPLLLLMLLIDLGDSSIVLIINLVVSFVFAGIGSYYWIRIRNQLRTSASPEQVSVS